MRVILAAILLSLIGCKDDSTGPDNYTPESFISVTGDLTESYAGLAFYGISTYTSGDTTRQYFTFIIQPKTAGSNPLAMLFLFKFNSEPPQAQTYQIAEHSLGEDFTENEFGGGYSGKNVTDYSGYNLTGGNIIITDTSSARMRGEFEISGYYRKLLERDTTRTVTISGHFSATEWVE